MASTNATELAQEAQQERVTRLKTYQTLAIESGSIELDHLRELVEQTQEWPGGCRVSVTEGGSFPGELGRSPDQIKVTRSARK